MWSFKMKSARVSLLAVCGLGLAAGVLLYGLRAAQPRQASKEDNPILVATPAEKSKPNKESLSTLLAKALLSNEREHVSSLEELVRVSRAIEAGGDISQVQVDEVERARLEASIRVLQREAEYNDFADRIGLQTESSLEGLQKAEEVLVLPLTRQLQKFQDAYTEFETLVDELLQYDSPDKAPKLRAEWHRTVPVAPLLRGTRLRTEFLPGWNAWEKLPAEDLRNRLAGYRDERRQLLKKETDMQMEGRSLSPADQQRLESLEREISLAEFEERLRAYESQPWNKTQRLKQQQMSFHYLVTAFTAVLRSARQERLRSLSQSWPKLPSVRLKTEDLLTGDWKQAEKVAMSALKRPEARTAAKRSLRELRTLAEVYRLQQSLIELAYAGRGAWRTILSSPPPPPGVSKQEDIGNSLRQLLSADRSVTRVKAQIITTWVNYLIARLELSRDLGLTPP